ncbi:FecR domain-containing protein [Aureimonas glaciei]|nr:FecR domain-containing protein [Aureimonas glaciei]
MAKRDVFLGAASAFLATFPCAASFAQSASSCVSVELRNPARVAVRCPGGLVLEAEAATGLLIRAPTSGGPPTSAEVSGQAVLINLSLPRRFEIRTPHAIASVRGTVYAVEVTTGSTAVFVAEGKVQVAKRGGRGVAILGPGEGVDVTSGVELTVRRWPEQRVRRLLSRFGR